MQVWTVVHKKTTCGSSCFSSVINSPDWRRRTLTYYPRLLITIDSLIEENSSANRSKAWSESYQLSSRWWTLSLRNRRCLLMLAKSTIKASSFMPSRFWLLTHQGVLICLADHALLHLRCLPSWEREMSLRGRPQNHYWGKVNGTW
jgi:hypothetical protein